MMQHLIVVALQIWGRTKKTVMLWIMAQHWLVLSVISMSDKELREDESSVPSLPLTVI